MPRRARPYWDKRSQCYRTEVGGKSKYFRGIAREDHVGIATAFAAYVAELEAGARPPEPEVFDVVDQFAAASRGVEPRTVATHRERLWKFAIWPLSNVSPK